METYNDWLEHFGIPGMHWGDRNGPPYPLNKTKVQKLRERRKKLKEKEKEQNLRFENAKLKRKIEEDKRNEKIEARKHQDEEKYQKELARRERRIGNKDPRRMTDQELDSVLERRRKENALRDENRKNRGAGKAFIKQILLDGATVAFTTYITQRAISLGQSKAHKYMLKHSDKYVTYEGTDPKDAVSKMTEASKSVAALTGTVGSILALRKGKDK